MKNKIKKWIRTSFISSVLVLSLVFGTVVSLASYDGSINQGKEHADESSMYLYTFDIELYNPCNSKDMDDDAVCVLWFDFKYKENNGCGKEKIYRFDMSWDGSKDRNLNKEILWENFIRSNDNSCYTQMSVWVPGIISNVHVKLNMDGGERLGFTVKGIYLNGFKINTGVDYVSSAYYDSEADIPCYVPNAAAVCPDGIISADAKLRDQYGGLLTDSTLKAVQDAAESGNYDMIYHYEY